MSQPSLDLEFAEEPGEPTYRVGELAAAIGNVLRRSFHDGVWVRGEIEGLRTDRNGHRWFRLCERTTEASATLDVVLFGGTAARLAPMLRRHRLRLDDGISVRIFVQVDFHGPSGRLTLKMAGLDPTYTLGRLAANREQLLRRLVADGVFDAQARLPLPSCPFRIGLVTSVGSAAWHDVMHELQRSRLRWHVVVCDTAVQGAAAEQGVAAAVRSLARRRLDVIAVVRGGGSRTDLATFDAEPVARAIAASTVPVLTGLGHEIDRAVADEVARLALKTPTAVAAWLIERARAHQAAVEARWAAITSRADEHLARHNANLVARAHRLAARTAAVVGRADERLAGDVRRLGRRGRVATAIADARLERAVGRVEGAGRRQLEGATRDLARQQQRLGQGAPRAAHTAERHLDVLAARADVLDPVRTLARGWTITRTVDGRLVRSAADVDVGDELVTMLAAGTTRSRVEETSP